MGLHVHVCTCMQYKATTTTRELIDNMEETDKQQQSSDGQTIIRKIKSCIKRCQFTSQPVTTILEMQLDIIITDAPPLQVQVQVESEEPNHGTTSPNPDPDPDHIRKQKSDIYNALYSDVLRALGRSEFIGDRHVKIPFTPVIYGSTHFISYANHMDFVKNMFLKVIEHNLNTDWAARMAAKSAPFDNNATVTGVSIQFLLSSPSHYYDPEKLKGDDDDDDDDEYEFDNHPKNEQQLLRFLDVLHMMVRPPADEQKIMSRLEAIVSAYDDPVCKLHMTITEWADYEMSCDTLHVGGAGSRNGRMKSAMELLMSVRFERSSAVPDPSIQPGLLALSSKRIVYVSQDFIAWTLSLGDYSMYLPPADVERAVAVYRRALLDHHTLY